MIKHFVLKDLDGQEILQLTGRSPVLFSDLGKYKSIKQLLGKEGFVVLLLQTVNVASGHFVAITENTQTGKIRYFDSYGFSPLLEIQEYVPFDNKNYPNYLVRLFRDVDFEYNKIDYQSKHPGVSTCGRWASIACKLRNLSLLQIRELFKGNSNAWLQDSDNVACMLTMLPIHNITEYLEDIQPIKKH